MRILIINPNSDPKMTSVILSAAESFAGDTFDEVVCKSTPGAPAFIDSYMTYREDDLMIEIAQLEEIMTALHGAGGMLMVHAEDNDMIETNIPRLISKGKTEAFYHGVSKPPAVEEKAIRDCIQMVSKTGGRLFVVHLASGAGMEMIARARANGHDVAAETCIHYLIFTEEKMKQDDGIKWICSPPLRNKTIQNRLWTGIADGRIHLVSTDDMAFSWEAKQIGQDRFDQCPNGIPGIEVRVPLLFSEGVVKGRLSLTRFVELIASEPARVFGLWPQKGSLLPGSDADIVLFDPRAEWVLGVDTLHMASDWCAYEGMSVTGRVHKVFSRGELIIDDGQCVAQTGRGRYLHRKLDGTCV